MATSEAGSITKSVAIVNASLLLFAVDAGEQGPEYDDEFDDDEHAKSDLTANVDKVLMLKAVNIVGLCFFLLD
jgi:hypothetical protein